jgi:hypothetical protein
MTMAYNHGTILLTHALHARYKRVSEADHVHRDIKVLEEDEVAWEVRK